MLRTRNSQGLQSATHAGPSSCFALAAAWGTRYNDDTPSCSICLVLLFLFSFRTPPTLAAARPSASQHEGGRYDVLRAASIGGPVRRDVRLLSSGSVASSSTLAAVRPAVGLTEKWTYGMTCACCTTIFAVAPCPLSCLLPLLRLHCWRRGLLLNTVRPSALSHEVHPTSLGCTSDLLPPQLVR